MLRKLMSDLGGRSFLVVGGFAIVAMVAATGLLFREEFTPEHWLSALTTCATLIGGWIAKRAVEEIGASFGKNGNPRP